MFSRRYSHLNIALVLGVWVLESFGTLYLNATVFYSLSLGHSSSSLSCPGVTGQTIVSFPGVTGHASISFPFSLFNE